MERTSRTVKNVKKEAVKIPDTVGEFLEQIRLGDPETYKNLTMIPVFAENDGANGCLTLDEAIKTGKFVVSEVDEGGNVPHLVVENGLESDVLLLDGEELVGAKQNRIVNTTIIIGMMKKVVIPVSCVEQGRWAYKSRKFSAGKSHLYASLRAKKVKDVSEHVKNSRSFDADQGRIWNGISEKHMNFNVRSETSAMADIFEAKTDDLHSYEKAFKPNPNQIGFITLINGKVVGLDAFGSPKVFPKVYAKLMRGYFLDAIDPTEKKGLSKEKSVSGLLKTVGKFVKAVKTSKTDACKSVGEGDDIRLENSDVNGFALVNKGSLVHLAAFPEPVRRTRISRTDPRQEE